MRGGVREVVDAVFADALGEPERCLLLLGTPLTAREPGWLQGLARTECLLERLSGVVMDDHGGVIGFDDAGW